VSNIIIQKLYTGGCYASLATIAASLDQPQGTSEARSPHFRDPYATIAALIK
jgi:hypothetical protein